VDTVVFFGIGRNKKANHTDAEAQRDRAPSRNFTYSANNNLIPLTRNLRDLNKPPRSTGRQQVAKVLAQANVEIPAE